MLTKRTEQVVHGLPTIWLLLLFECQQLTHTADRLYDHLSVVVLHVVVYDGASQYLIQLIQREEQSDLAVVLFVLPVGGFFDLFDLCGQTDERAGCVCELL